MEKEKILGVMFSKMTLNETANYLKNVLEKEKLEPFHIITANPEIVMQINRDSKLKEIERKAGLITADGIGIVYGSKILGGNIKERVTGVELLVNLLMICEKNNHSIYFLGANEETSIEFEKYVMENYPKIKIAGRRNGYFDVKNDSEVLDDINRSNAEVLVMGMGSPRSHMWFDSRRSDLNIKLTVDVGGGFDSLTGRVKRAPVIIQKLNIEWLYRRIQTPSRAERQKDLYRFAFEVIKERLRKKKKYS